MKTYKLEQRRGNWKTIAVAHELGVLLASWQATPIANGKRIVRSDGKLILQELPTQY